MTACILTQGEETLKFAPPPLARGEAVAIVSGRNGKELAVALGGKYAGKDHFGKPRYLMTPGRAEKLRLLFECGFYHFEDVFILGGQEFTLPEAVRCALAMKGASR
jgi:hypothetical protein